MKPCGRDGWCITITPNFIASLNCCVLPRPPHSFRSLHHLHRPKQGRFGYSRWRLHCLRWRLHHISFHLRCAKLCQQTLEWLQGFMTYCCIAESLAMSLKRLVHRCNNTSSQKLISWCGGYRSKRWLIVLKQCIVFDEYIFVSFIIIYYYKFPISFEYCYY